MVCCLNFSAYSNKIYLTLKSFYMTLINVKRRPAEKSFNNFIDDFFPQLPSILRDDYVAPFSKQITPVNVKQNENGYVLEVVAPGFSKEDIKIALDNYKLTISAEKKS